MYKLRLELQLVTEIILQIAVGSWNESRFSIEKPNRGWKLQSSWEWGSRCIIKEQPAFFPDPGIYISSRTISASTRFMQALVVNQPNWTSQRWAVVYKGCVHTTYLQLWSEEVSPILQGRSFWAVPATETVLCCFVASMTKAGLKHHTMKVYLSGVRFLHIAGGAEDPFLLVLHRLRLILQGIKKVEAEKASIVGKGSLWPRTSWDI